MLSTLRKLGLLALLVVLSCHTWAQSVTATWDFQNGKPDGISSTSIQGTTGTVASDVDGVVLSVDATGTNGKLAGRASDAQFNANTIIKVPVISTSDVVTVTSYPNYHNYTVGGVVADADVTTHTATALEVSNGCVEIVATATSYLYSITVTQVTPSEETVSFDDVAASFVWTIGNEDEATISGEVSGGVSSTSMSYGTDLTASVVTGATYDGKWGNTGNLDMAAWTPGTSNPGNSEDDMVEFTIKMRSGVKFTPTSVTYNAVKNGTDGSTFSWSYTLDGEESTITDMPADDVIRDKAGSTASLTHSFIPEQTAVKTFTFRVYMSACANNKKISIGNVKIEGIVSGAITPRSFKDFKVDFRSKPYTVTLPESGELPAGVSIEGGAWHDNQHGYNGTPVVTVPVDGPVKFTIGTCGYGGTCVVKTGDGEVLGEIDTKTNGCDSSTSYDKNVVWYYNVEAADTLTFTLNGYCPYFFAEACDLLPNFKVSYFDTTGKPLGSMYVMGNTKLAYFYGESDVTIPSGCAFRGWFNSDKTTAVKVAEGSTVLSNLNLYAKATPIEEATSTARFVYDLTKAYFYAEDHECFLADNASYHDAQHGWEVKNGGYISLPVSSKAIIALGNCKYTSADTAIVTNSKGDFVAGFNPVATTDGDEFSFRYDGTPDTLTITFTGGSAYVHKVSVFNVIDFISFDEASGYYIIPAGDINSFLIALAEANGKGNVKIFLPNGTYDMGDQVLTSISGNNISIIGESMDGTIIRNAPAIENEGIGTTATLLNTSDGLYLQDLTIQNALDYYKSGSAGRAVCLQDKGTNTICKNVKMLSYQDTYYSNKASNFYWEDSEIHGTVDYLCGDGNVVYNRVKLVNESRSADSQSGDCTICAPNNTATSASRYNWGYVFLDCTVETYSQTFNFARAWGGEPKATFINTQILSGEIKNPHFTLEGMNVVAAAFAEYNTTNAEGSLLSPESAVLEFFHKDGTKKSYETVLSADSAAQFTVANIYGEWAPDKTAAQVSTTALTLSEDGLSLSWTPVEGCEAYLVYVNDSEAQLVSDATEIIWPAQITSASVRSANGRGGFGPAVSLGQSDDNAINYVKANAEVLSTAIYSVGGARLSQLQHGLNIVVLTYTDGTTEAQRVIVK